jgi:Domain of unknown function (DUF4190)
MGDEFDEADPQHEDITARRRSTRRPRQPINEDQDWEDDRRPSVRRDLPPDDGVSTLIPYKNPKALIAYYCGVFGLMPILGVPLAIAAVILGTLGLRYVKAHPTAKGTAHAIVGIVLGSISVLYHFSCIAFMVVGAIMSNKR